MLGEDTGSWQHALAELTRQGVLDRATVVDACVARLLRGGGPTDHRVFLPLPDRRPSYCLVRPSTDNCGTVQVTGPLGVPDTNCRVILSDLLRPRYEAFGRAVGEQ